MADQRCSLWLMPPANLRERYARIIRRLAAAYDTPPFLPHVTLLGELPGPPELVRARCTALAAQIAPYELRLTAIGYQDVFFRALFVRVDPTPPVLAAYDRAVAQFPQEQPAPYMPHLSLLYGDFPAERKPSMTAAVGEDVSGQFRAEALYLVDVARPIEQWQVRETFPLGG